MKSTSEQANRGGVTISFVVGIIGFLLGAMAGYFIASSNSVKPYPAWVLGIVCFAFGAVSLLLCQLYIWPRIQRKGGDTFRA